MGSRAPEYSPVCRKVVKYCLASGKVPKCDFLFYTDFHLEEGRTCQLERPDGNERGWVQGPKRTRPLVSGW